MFDFAFDHRTLGREFVKADFKADPQLIDDTYRDTFVAEARAQASSGFINFTISQNSIKGKSTYQIDQLEHELILRKFSRNIRKITKVKQSDRNTIIKSLKQILSEGHHFRVYKLDLKDFYESIDRTSIEASLRADGGLSPPTLHVFQFIDAELNALGINGLPRGLTVSAVLSEYVMRSFDQTVKSLENVYYYARYVDDIIVLTTGQESEKSFLRRVRKALPRGVFLNHNKTKVINFHQPIVKKIADQVLENHLDFLGYRFNVYKILKKDKILSREVYADISPNKLNRFKSRIILSAMQFNKDLIFKDLLDRLRVLCGNYNVYDFDRKIRRNVGIYYNYRFLDLEKSTSIRELDEFLKRLFLAKTGKIAAGFTNHLSPKHRRRILNLRFARSFETKNFSYFEINRLTHLVGCWAYE